MPDHYECWEVPVPTLSPMEPKPLYLTHMHDSEAYGFAKCLQLTLYSEQSQEFIVIQWF